MYKETEVYSVTFTSLDDGHRVEYGLYTTKVLADDAMKSLGNATNPKVIPTRALIDGCGNYYSSPRPIKVNTGEREAILAKLTPRERKILGV